MRTDHRYCARGMLTLPWGGRTERAMSSSEVCDLSADSVGDRAPGATILSCLATALDLDAKSPPA
jgi:hypothetical protein